MSLLPYIIEFFLRSKPEASSHPLIRIFGFSLVFTSSLVGAYLLFQFLTPELGTLESGAILCGIMGGMGLLMLLISRRKSVPSHPLNEIMENASTAMKKFDLSHIVSNNGPKMVALALAVGFILSQVGAFKKSR